MPLQRRLAGAPLTAAPSAVADPGATLTYSANSDALLSLVTYRDRLNNPHKGVTGSGVLSPSDAAVAAGSGAVAVGVGVTSAAASAAVREASAVASGSEGSIGADGHAVSS